MSERTSEAPFASAGCSGDDDVFGFVKPPTARPAQQQVFIQRSWLTEIDLLKAGFISELGIFQQPVKLAVMPVICRSISENHFPAITNAEFLRITLPFCLSPKNHYISPMYDKIEIRGARVHNLKNLDVDLPRNKLIVITGVSGSGKSSLAFDTLFAEGQRRFVESLSAYARQFLERMDRPDVDEIRGISPAVAIEQKNPTRNSRSTVATATELHDYLRLLYARIGRTFCPQCGAEVKRDQVQDAVDKLFSLPPDTRVQVTFPLSSRSRKDVALELADLRSRGFYRLQREGELVEIDNLQEKDLAEPGSFLVLVDRLKVQEKDRGRLADSLDLAFQNGSGKAVVLAEGHAPLRFSQAFECSNCHIKFIEPQPRLFSFNNPFGACPECNGFGEIIELDLDLVIPDKTKSLVQGAVAPWNTPKRRDIFSSMLDVAAKEGININRPWRDLPEAHRQIIIEGQRPFPGIRGFFRKLERKKYKLGIRVLLSRYRGYVSCPACNLTRLRPEALNVRVNGKHIGEVGQMPIRDAHQFFENLELTDWEQEVAHQILQELRQRLNYLVDVGLDYLNLNRRTQTLSGGEYQRINLATSVGFKLVGSLYVLDEPSIGLHPRDNERLIRILQALRDLGNTVVVVEHDREMMEISDHLLDLGPRAGEHGGQLVYQGSFQQAISNGVSTLTTDYLKDKRQIPAPQKRRPGSGRHLKIINASEHNLKKITVEIPLGVFVAVTGVSGSGKSTLMHDILYAGLARHFGSSSERAGAHDRIEGVEHLDGCMLVDQSPIGRTPRSNPATYTKAFDPIRQLFAETLRAKARGMKPGTFSFNTAGGRCERCEGAGVEKVEMQFLADLYLPCEECQGARFRKDVLEVRYKGKNIHEVLNLTVSEALAFFKDVRRVTAKLRTLEEVGLGYLRLGQPATTLSGGEAQRVKLAAHLAEKTGRHLLYLFDEPTTGLHFFDIEKLLACFEKLIAAGHSVLVIEHNLDVIKCADHVIDLGPEGGDEGGHLVAAGTPEQLAAQVQSHTGRFLKPYLA